jgi:sporulation protein YqfC
VREIVERTAEKLRLPAELLDGVPRLTLTGARQLRIENHRCLLSFSAETLEVGCGKLRLLVLGEDLRIVCLDREELLVEGKILSVEVENG